MSEIERVQWYIDRAKVKLPAAYSMDLAEGLALSIKAYESKVLPIDVIILAFNYGRVKGYRAAKAEAKKRATV